MARANHQNNFATNLTSNTAAGDTTSPLNAIPSIDAPFYLAFDATNINGHYEALPCTSKTATNVNHAALAYAHTTAEEVRLVIPAAEMNNLGTLVEQVDGAWVAWTPTWTNLTVGNGTVVSKYSQIGKIVHFYIKLTLGSSTSISGSVTFSLPKQNVFSTTAVDPEIGRILFRDISADSSYVGVVRVSNANTGVLSAFNVAATYINCGGISSAIPFTWATGDVISISGTYEAA